MQYIPLYYKVSSLSNNVFGFIDILAHMNIYQGLGKVNDFLFKERASFTLLLQTLTHKWALIRGYR